MHEIKRLETMAMAANDNGWNEKKNLETVSCYDCGIHY